jgi:hypothetical protein
MNRNILISLTEEQAHRLCVLLVGAVQAEMIGPEPEETEYADVIAEWRLRGRYELGSDTLCDVIDADADLLEQVAAKLP